MSRGMEGWAWAEGVAPGGGTLERALGPGYQGLWLILGPEGEKCRACDLSDCVGISACTCIFKEDCLHMSSGSQ